MKIKKFSIILIAFTLFFSLLVGQSNTTTCISKNNGKKNLNSNISMSNNGGCEWNRTWDGYLQDTALDIKVDSSNNIYVTGVSNFKTVGGGQSLILLKYNSLGDLQWSRTWAVTGDTIGYGIAFDSLNNIYVVGTSFPIMGSWPIILLKYNSEGELDWYRQHVIGDDSCGAGIAIDSSDNIYLSGWDEIGGNQDILLVKCNSSGFIEWSRTWGGAGMDAAYRIALDSSNNIYLACTIDFLGGNSDICLVKYDSSGNKEWHSTRHVGNFDMGWNVALDSSENIFLAGAVGDWGNLDGVLIKFNSDGQHQWNQTWGGSDNDISWTLEIDSSDNIYLGGTLDLIGGMFEFAYFGDITLVKYDNSGQYQWDYTRRVAHQEGCQSLALDSSEENIYLAGSSDELGTNDTLVVKYNLKEPITDGNGEQAIPGYNTVLIITINFCILVYFIKKLRKEKK
ncbi:MAG: SBBP repeat-containing protein [Promethearchaeota archaeon]